MNKRKKITDYQEEEIVISEEDKEEEKEEDTIDEESLGEDTEDYTSKKEVERLLSYIDNLHDLMLDTAYIEEVIDISLKQRKEEKDWSKSLKDYIVKNWKNKLEGKMNLK